MKNPGTLQFTIVSFLLLILVMLVLLVSRSFAQPSFSTATDFTGTSGAYISATADFNGDGKQDIVVTNRGSNSVSIYLNTTIPGATTPTFSAKTDFPVGFTTLVVITTDINGDGKPDLAIANSDVGGLSILLNTTVTGASTPTFSAGTNFATGFNPFVLVAGDINGDGKPDLVIEHSGVLFVSVYLNTTTTGASTPTLSARTDIAITAGSYSVALKDLNGDGKLDIATTNTASSTVSVFLNTTTTGAATPTFSAKTDFACSDPYSIQIADMNGDGKQDLVVLGHSSSLVGVLLNTTATGSSTPTFSAYTSFAAGNHPNVLTVGDLNDDGKPDMVICATDPAGKLGVYLNTTTPGSVTPTFTALTEFATNGSPQQCSIADFNGDGKPDLAAVTVNFFVSVLMNTTTVGVAAPSFSTNTDFTTGSGPYSVSTGDLNGDGKPDLAVANLTSTSVSVFLNTTTPGASTPTFSAKTDFTVGIVPQSVTIGDLNGDGKPDLAATSFDGNSVSVLLNTTAPGASTPAFSVKTDFTTGSNPTRVTIGDLNGDGKPDLAVSNKGGNSVSVLLNTTTPGASTPTFSAKTDLTAGSEPFFVSIGDLNGDGKPDLVVANYASNSASVFLNTTTPGASTPTFSAKTDFITGTNLISVSIGDLNGDGKPDLATANNNAGTVSVFLNTTPPGASTPTFSAKTDFTTGAQPRSISIGDLNGDGKPDLAVANLNSNSVSVLLNTTTPGASTPTFTAKTDFTTGGSSISGATVDFNGDGKPDLAMANSGSNSISVLLNTAVLPLPVELSSFTATVDKQNVILKWSTVQEENNRGFEIERSSFGAGWRTVGFAEGHGTVNQINNYSFTERGMTTGTYSYRLKQIDYNGNYEYYDLTNQVIIGIPAKFDLAQNFPNPFNPVSVIRFQIPVRGFVSLKVFDVSGREVSQLVNEIKDAGYYSVTFDAKSLSSGTYFYKLTSDNFSDVKKMVVVK